MEQAPAPDGLPPSLRFLKGLVITLMITMILAVITVVAVIVTRMPQSTHRAPTLPDSLTLPTGAQAQAVTFGTGWIAVVTQDDRILVYSPAGVLQQEVPLLGANP